MIRRDGGADEAVRVLREAFLPPTSNTPLPEGSIILPKPVRVDRNKFLPDMIREARLNNEKHAIANITEDKFHVDRSGVIQNRLVYEKELILLAPYKDGVTTREWWDWMDEHDFQREETPELMAVARDFPEYQRKFYIRAFGSSDLYSGGGLYCPELWSRGGLRKAGALWYGASGQWNLRNRALVSRKRR